MQYLRLTENYATFDSIAEHIKNKYSFKLEDCSLDEVKLFIKQVICMDPRAQRFHSNGMLLFDEKTVRELDAISIDDTPSIRKFFSSPSRDKLRDKAINDIIDELVALHLRAPANTGPYNQIAGHINNDAAIVWNQTLSSEINKKQSTLLANYNINMMAISKGPEHVCVRSGRSDNIESLLRLMHFNFLHALNSSNKPGISIDSKGKCHFQLTLISAQGNKHQKTKQDSVIARLAPQNLHPESQSLEAIAATVDKIWPTQMPILLNARQADGTQIGYYAEKPILKNYPLGFGANHKSVVKKARSWSRAGVLRELYALSRAPNLPKAINACLEQIPKAFFVYGPEVQSQILNSVWTQCKGLQRTEETQRYYDILQGMKMTLTNRDFEENKCLDAHSPGVELAYSLKLEGLFNSAYSFQCKAGCDRALIMASLHLAQREVNTHIEWKKVQHLNDVDLRFRELFKQFLNDLGASAFIACRGKPLFKSKNKPFLHLIWHKNC